MEVLLFGGTSEGRALAEWLVAESIPATVCVATQYGGALLPPGADARVGRLDGAGMGALMASRPFTHVVDATHPYADRATRTIREAAAAAGLPLCRLVRDGGEAGDWMSAPDMAAAARMAANFPGNILLTTGSKALDAFAAPGLRARCFPRVLPTVDALARCLALGFAPGHILCMQGPCSAALNRAILEQYDIKLLITKASGAAGGFWEKVEAARETGRALLVVERPLQEEGCTLEQVKAMLKEAGDREA